MPTPRSRAIGRTAAIPIAACFLATTLVLAQAGATPPAAAVPSAQQPVVLDSVIAVINGDVLLKSDLQSEMDLAALQPLSVPGGPGFEQRAAQRLINRTLILQQMKSQQMTEDVSAEKVQKDLGELRKQLPACVRYACQTAAGWVKFLGDHNLSAAEVETRWRQRMEILNFIDLRFRAGVRIGKPEIAAYYTKTFVPQFKAENAKPPALDAVSDRIEEVLLQQQVNVLLQEWLKSLRDQGSVLILDPALGQSNPNPTSDDDGGGE